MTTGYWVQVNEPGKPPRIESITAEVEFGRDCEGIVLDDPTVSRRHFKLDPTAVGLVVEDLGSANGTLIDGVRMTDPLVLEVGHRIGCGETEVIVHSARETTVTAEGATGADLHADPSKRVSEEARRLGAAARKGRRGTTR